MINYIITDDYIILYRLYFVKESDDFIYISILMGIMLDIKMKKI